MSFPTSESHPLSVPLSVPISVLMSVPMPARAMRVVLLASFFVLSHHAVAAGAEGPAQIPFWWSSSTPKAGDETPPPPPLGAPYFHDEANAPSGRAPNPDSPPNLDEVPNLDEALWARWAAKEAAYWKRLEEAVRKMWGRYTPPSQTVWVDYSDPLDAAGQVDFENGAVVIEAVVVTTDADPHATARHLIAKKAQEMTRRVGADGRAVLAGLFSRETLDAIDAGRLEPIMEALPFTGADGVKRYRFFARLSLAADHVHQRRERYREAIEVQARRHRVDPALVTAVMHTESAFNPLARSPTPAFGLMQLVPRFGAREAYAHLHGVSAALSPEYLYHPENNIELGVTYLARLEQIYFKDVRDPVKRRYLAICAYNWGPTAVRRAVRLDQANAMTPRDLYDTLQRRVPAETRDYLRRVETRRLLYGGS